MPQSNFDIGKINLKDKRALEIKHKNGKMNIAHFVYVPSITDHSYHLFNKYLLHPYDV